MPTNEMTMPPKSQMDTMTDVQPSTAWRQTALKATIARIEHGAGKHGETEIKNQLQRHRAERGDDVGDVFDLLRQAVGGSAGRMFLHYPFALFKPGDHPQTRDDQFSFPVTQKGFHVAARHQACGHDVAGVFNAAKPIEDGIINFPAPTFEPPPLAGLLAAIDHVGVFGLHQCRELQEPFRLLFKVTVDQEHPLARRMFQSGHHGLVVTEVAG